MLNDSHLFDFSGYQDDHPCFASMSLDEVKRIKQLNKKAMDKFKDELGLPPKLYWELASDDVITLLDRQNS